MNSKAIKRQLLAAIAMVLVAALALGSSTFAWFVQNTSVQAKTATVSASTAYALMISETGKNTWATTYSFADTMTYFAPVSTIGTTDGSAFSFYKQKEWKSETSGNTTVYNVNKVQALEEAEKGKLYWTKTFDIKASQPCTLYLDSSTTFTPGTRSDGITNIMNKSLRLALVVSDSEGVKSTYVYQIDALQDATNSYNTTLLSQNCNGISASVGNIGSDDAPVGASINTLPLGGSAGTYTTLKQIGTSGVDSALATKPDENKMLTEKNQADALYNFEKANDICNVTAYIWMEGCDYDCNSSVVQQITGADNTVAAILGFSAAEYNPAPSPGP